MNEEFSTPPAENEPEGLPQSEHTIEKLPTPSASAPKDSRQRKADAYSRKFETSDAHSSKGSRKWWFKTIGLLILIGISIGILFGVTSLIEGGNALSFSAMVKGIDWTWFAVLIGVVIAYMLFESAKYLYILLISTKKLYPRVALKTMFLGKYYDGITPLGTGGQPFQIYYLHKKNSIPAGVATAVPLVKYVVSTITYCLTALIFFTFASEFLPGSWGDTTILVIAWVCVAANVAVPVIIVVCSLFPNFGKKFIATLIHVLWKLKIVKHKYRVMHKYVYEMKEYRIAFKAILSKWWKIIPLVLICVVASILNRAVPFFVIVAIADVEPTLFLFLQVLCLSNISFYASSFVPTPGGSGAFEGAGAIVFATALATLPGATGIIGWTILVWRLFSYYIYIISGIGINIFEIIRSSVRKRRAERSQTAE